MNNRKFQKSKLKRKLFCFFFRNEIAASRSADRRPDKLHQTPAVTHHLHPGGETGTADPWHRESGWRLSHPQHPVCTSARKLHRTLPGIPSPRQQGGETQETAAEQVSESRRHAGSQGRQDKDCRTEIQQQEKYQELGHRDFSTCVHMEVADVWFACYNVFVSQINPRF